MRQELERERGGDLVREVRNADIECRKLRPQRISLYNLEIQASFIESSFLHLRDHSGIHLDCDHLLDEGQDLHRQITRSRPDLQCRIGLLQF